MDHALVIGGTGMLRGLCRELTRRGWAVSALARRHAALAALARSAAALPGSIHPLPADYHDDAQLALAVRTAVAAHGPIALSVSWIHASATRAPGLIADMLAGARPPCRFFEILGSANADPSSKTPSRARQIKGVAYRRVVLGFVIESRASRWLTDDEISHGILGAIDADALETTVGVVGPWSARP